MPIAHHILNTTYFERTSISPADLLFCQALNLDRGVFISDSEMRSDKPESLSLKSWLKPHKHLTPDRQHTRRLSPNKILSSNKNDYRLQDLISSRLFSTNVTRLVPFYCDFSRISPQEIAAYDSEEFLLKRILEHRGNLRGRSKKDVLFKMRWLGYDSSHET